ncbi:MULTISPECIES: ABC transporter ATP-binding protein [unclassified Lentimicrobium]|uniref:ABC transporter ATP-binding protein n=1 Tax=unclassified Lentimicrobium TaxID=2677434 RepID=UPI001556B788|nr:MULTISPECIES: ATP-binding cassette domain-containing protein [unclassified Lentimicrobium]NPD45569.1 ABC transporter ATP-binding protein [Lentimicrobium sp. S6]NPD83648.1 ABC transporter ATP-binding protein [Lentimicrobium sp. L6]
MKSSETIIKLKDIGKTFKIKDRNTNSIRSKVTGIFNPNQNRVIKALENINLEIRKGEFFGVIGHNGSGKSTLLKVMTSVYQPDKGGVIDIQGSFQRLALGTGFDLELTVRENIYLNGSLFGLTFKKIGSIFNQIIEYAELESFVDTKVKYFSSGMVSRLAFAIAINVDADILFLDEFGGVGDESFKTKSENSFKESIIKGKTIIHVSHDLNTIQAYCDRVLLLSGGKPIMVGKPEEVIQKYHEIQ